ncbi:bifunctional 4-hydroxy-2-oxoglutarate aldolase/2-dehydro-3-deoxy-phosphogluconate aldolase [soil metagenome]
MKFIRKKLNAVFDPDLGREIEACGIIAVLVVESWQNAVPLAKALLAGGINIIELTLRTSSASDAIRAVVSEVPEMIIGAGTILTTKQLKTVADLGVSFGVSPGFNSRVVEAAKEQNFSFAPGVVTPTDIELAVESGCRLLKFFPAEPSGGLDYLRTILSPFAHLGLKFIPLGGLDMLNVTEYISDPDIIAIGGSWIAPQEYIREGRWKDITERAVKAISLVELTRRNNPEK